MLMMFSEEKTIAESIRFLEQGSYSKVKKYWKQIEENEHCVIGDYSYFKEIYCWVVWKCDDEGEEMYKVVPRTRLSTKQVRNILRNQSWIRP